MTERQQQEGGIHITPTFFYISVLSSFVGNLAGLLLVNIPNGDHAIIGVDLATILLTLIATYLYYKKRIRAIDGIVAIVSAIMVTFFTEAFSVPYTQSAHDSIVVILYDMQSFSVFLLFLGFVLHRYWILFLGTVMVAALVHAIYQINDGLAMQFLPMVGIVIGVLCTVVYHFRQVLAVLFINLEHARNVLQNDRDLVMELKMQSEKALQDVQDAEDRIVFKGKRAVVGIWARNSLMAVEQPFHELESQVKLLQPQTEKLSTIILKAKQNMRPALRRELDSCYREFDSRLHVMLGHAESAFKTFGKATTHSVGTPGRFNTLSLQEVLEESLNSTQAEHYQRHPDSKVLLRFHPLNNNSQIEGIRGDLSQAFSHIYRNAFQAIAEAESQRDQKYAPWIATTLFEDGDCLCVSIEDNGTGIPDFVQETLFDPFVTTKPLGQGVGLGLFTSRPIIEQTHKGSLTCESVKDVFTRFHVCLPRRNKTQ